jgi:hypothetical protein
MVMNMDHADAERRARKVHATARANLVGHVARDDRVAEALRTARSNIVKFDPKRLASIRALAPAHELQRQAAAARQERVKRTLGAARDTLKRLAHIKPPSHMSGQIVHKMTENARVAPEAPSPAPRRQEDARSPLADSIESLSYRFEVFREAVPEAMGEIVDELRAECRRWFEAIEREDKLLRGEIDLLHRELAMLRKGIAA